MNEKKQALLIVNQRGNQYFPLQLKECDIISPFASDHVLNRFFRKVILKTGMNGLARILFKHMDALIEKNDWIIVFDTGNADGIVKYIQGRYAGKRIIVWYWNPVQRTISPECFKSLNAELWSFDLRDCQKYDMKFNTQFYISDNTKRKKYIDMKDVDVLFIGKDKNRAEKLIWLEKKLKSQNLTSLFYVTRPSLKSEIRTDIAYRPNISYLELMGYIEHTKAILDLVHEKQSGLTLRPLEALFFKKKLITNDLNIQNYDLYNKNNIFIIGVDKEDEMGKFIYSDYDNTNYDDLIEKYDLRSWLGRFESV